MKVKASKLIKNLPLMLTKSVSLLKDNFDENGQEILESASGKLATLIKLFGQTFLDKYFDKIKGDKLEEFGESVYLKSAYIQAGNSIASIEDELIEPIEPGEFSSIYFTSANEELKTFTAENIILIFQPEYHPLIVFVKNHYVALLKKLDVNASIIEKFLEDFNSNIATEIKSNFGKSYSEHQEQISQYLLDKNETKLLWDTSKLGKIGFTSTENLKYEETFALWKDVNTFKNFENDILPNDSKNKEEGTLEYEASLAPIVALIKNYFEKDSDKNLEKILFIVADFGKGKSVFLKHYASQLAKNYLNTKEGDFPIYFNLRDFHRYAHNTKLGVIDDYLLTKYAININDPYFANKKYVFLIDSLDESGELNKISIDKVIGSIKQIQNIDKEKYRTNKIIVTTRPFDDGLDNHLKGHSPHLRVKGDRNIHQYLSIYGFKKEQFNNWLVNSIKNAPIKDTNSNEIIQKILSAISKDEIYDVYNDLIGNGTLSQSELRRPIFAYMIYKLILNNVNFLEVGKIGVYLSFLNLLSKDAKHINDSSYSVNLTEEFEYRNLLHSISALWMFERHQGKQGALSKADICRVLDGFKSEESDNEVLDRYKDKNINEIKFLSHSYFGENDNKLHFQHQSFAEILLAEYYLKVFIKYSLDEDSNFEEARAKLVLGFPTEQTISFLIDLLNLLKDSTDDSVSQDTLEKRRLLFPLLASLATKKNNNLFCNDLYYDWFKGHSINLNEDACSEKLIKNWCFDSSKIDKILELCKEIMNSNNTYLLSKNDVKSSLYDNELTLIKSSLNEIPLDFDRWVSLLVGNTLCNNFDDEENPILFNTKFEIEPKKIFALIIQSSSRDDIPHWGGKLFLGINMKSSNERMKLFLNLFNMDFSYSHLKNIVFCGSEMLAVKFNYIRLENVDFSNCRILGTSFNRIVKIENSKFRNISIDNNLIPFCLMLSKSISQFYMFNLLHSDDYIKIPVIKDKGGYDSFMKDNILTLTSQFFAYYYAKNEITIANINELVKFESAVMKKKYISNIKAMATEYKK